MQEQSSLRLCAAPRRIVPPNVQREQPLLCELMQLTWVAKPEERLDFAAVLKRIEHSAVAKAMPKPGKPGPGPVQPRACHSAHPPGGALSLRLGLREDPQCF